MDLLNRMVLATLPLVPGPLMRRLSSRYIAGETLAEAIGQLEELRRKGHPGILDLLGEDVADEASARHAAHSYHEAVDSIAKAGLDVHVSVKPTHFGLNLSEELCLELYARLAETCRERALRLRVEMEDHPTTDGTLRIYERLRKSFDNVGIVFQSRLFRTLDDIEALAPGPIDVRMVKGIYLEPGTIAHTEPEPIREAFVRCVERIAERAGSYIALATHDEVLAERCLAALESRGFPEKDIEFQVLLGVRKPLWREWVRAGHRVRVYAPYGPEWRAYSQRRLRKNPQILKHIMRDTFGLS